MIFKSPSVRAHSFACYHYYHGLRIDYDCIAMTISPMKDLKAFIYLLSISEIWEVKPVNIMRINVIVKVNFKGHIIQKILEYLN